MLRSRLYDTRLVPRADVVAYDGSARLGSAFLLLTTLEFIMRGPRLLSVYFSLSGDVSASVRRCRATTVQVCTDGRQEGRAVYYCRPPCMPAATDDLNRGFPKASVSFLTCSKCSL